MYTTEKLFYNDSYISEFKAKILSVRKEEELFLCILDRTAFFPTEAGQSCDTGKIDGANVVEVREEKGEIIHFIDKEPTSSEVFCKIDWEKRFRKMQNHTGEHIVSGLLNSVYGFDNVGFHLGSTDVTIDFNGVLSDAQLSEIEKAANEAIVGNIEIKAEFPSAEELANMNYRSKLEIKDNLRIVTIAGYDVCACCAPHVKYTGEVGIIKLLDSIHYKGGTRLHMLCGFDALYDYGRRYKNVKNISELLSAKQENVYEAVIRLTQNLAEEKAKNSALRFEILKEKTKNLPFCEKNRVVFEEDADFNFLRNYANLAVKSTAEICAVFSGDDENGYKYVIAAECIDLSKKVNEINSALNGNGGGKSKMIQGSVKAKADKIKEFFLV